MTLTEHQGPLAILVSGGLDSAILVGEAARHCSRVYPLYVRFGLAWEEVEQAHLRRFLQALAAPAVQPLTLLDLPVGDLYGQHWSVTGRDVPGAETADEAVFLPGRNVLLLAKALLWCHLHQVPAVAMAPLESNPFPDATPAFFQAFEQVVNQSVGGAVRVLRPYAHLHKIDVLRRGSSLPLQHSFSCIHPRHGLHCGQCNKCAERKKGFAEAGLADPTAYDDRS
ncbi:MAG: 7-cyano-7-deazaguanine synthase [Gemmataceae bacterium]